MGVVRLNGTALLVGLVVGLAFGFVDLIMTWLFPLADDTPWALIRFYGPMFLIWILVSFRAARRTGRFTSGVAAGAVVAFATFSVFIVLNFVRVNVFLDQLTWRADWQNLAQRFRSSGTENFRLFVNLDYIKGTPLKIAVASAVGGVMGVVGGSLGSLSRSMGTAALAGAGTSEPRQ